MLCLSNPKGPEDVAECVEPIQKLWDHLWDGGSMPGCDTNGDGDDGNDTGDSAIQKVAVERSYDDDDDLEWIKVKVDGKLVKTIDR